MFHSSNSANPFPQIPPSLHPPPHPPPFLGHERQSIFLHHHPHPHADLLVNDSVLANSPFIDPISGITISNNARTTNPQKNGHHFSPQINVLPIKKGGKKDRHSKIRTAQGSRDRRVRLSIEIARKFFDLQDALGYNRASKTIDWLLTKSTTAIKELMQMKHSCSGSSGGADSLFSQEVVLSGTNVDGVDYNGDLQGIVSERMEKNVKVQDRVAFHLLARESKARARARERTRERAREKMSTKKLINNSEELVPDSSIPTFNGPLSCSKVCDQGMRSTGLTKEEDSVVIKGKQSSIFGDLENLSKGVASSPNIPRNLDSVGTTTFPRFYLLPEFQMSSKPWEA